METLDPMTAPTVSAILCVFNGERYLRGALESVRAQTYPVHELIVVDDGSTDGTAGIARGFPGVTYLFQPNAGLASARNAGLKAAGGEFIAFIDHDDEWMPDKLRAQVAFLQAHPEIGVVGCHSVSLLDVDRPSWLPDKHARAPQPSLLPSAVLTRAAAFRHVGGFDPAFPVSNDYDWLMRAGQLGWRRHMLAETLVRRRIHEDNLTNNRVAIKTELFRALKAAAHRQQEPRK